MDEILGEDYQSRIDELVSEFVEDLLLEGIFDKKTGELDIAKFRAAEQSREALHRHAREQLSCYESYCTGFRVRHRMRPFDWRWETVCRVREAIRRNPWSKYPEFRHEKVFRDKKPWPEYPAMALAPGAGSRFDQVNRFRTFRPGDPDPVSEPLESVLQDVARKYFDFFER